MYRWVQRFDHMLDNLQNGWLATERPIHLSKAAAAALRRNVGQAVLSAAGATILPTGKLEIIWKGISLTHSDRQAFQSDNWGLFGEYGVLMTDDWLGRQEVITPEYLTDDIGDLDRLVVAVKTARSDAERRRVLWSFDREEFGRERERRVLAEGVSRIPLTALTDVAGCFVPFDSEATYLRQRFGQALSVTVVPEKDKAPIPDDLW